MKIKKLITELEKIYTLVDDLEKDLYIAGKKDDDFTKKVVEFVDDVDYELSFLDKDHTLILDVDKNTELPNGVGDKGLIIIPQNSHPQVAFNIDFYLQKAGIANTGITTQQNTTTTNNPTI